MSYNKIVISSGHGLHVRGACGILDEVDEARRAVELIAGFLRAQGVGVVTYHDDVSQAQNENLNRIVDFHNGQTRDLDVSVHFNAYEQVDKPMGTEVLYTTQAALAAKVSAAIAENGLINRGGKQRTDLFFLNNTAMPAILVEVCFVDSEADADVYLDNLHEICESIADVIGGEGEPEAPTASFMAAGRCSYFGGPDDHGVSPSEGLAFYDEVMQAPWLFLPYQPDGTDGLARRLNPHIHYLACRWDYEETPREMLQNEVALVKALKTGIALTAFPADWGPHQDTGRVADLSPGLMGDLGIETDDQVEITFPYVKDVIA